MNEPVNPLPHIEAVPENIFLVGLMGAGKTSVGKLLARRLGKVFHDSDHEIERATGVKIPVIFEIEGEAGFRARESRLLSDLVHRRNIVLATGGGAVLSLENRKLLSQCGTVVYLRAAPQDLWRRTRHDRNRPLLQTADPLLRLQELFVQRDPLYQEIADIVVDTGSQSLGSLTHRLEQRLKRSECPGPADPAQTHDLSEPGLPMNVLTVPLGDRSYVVHIGPGLLGQGELIATALPQKKAVIITNETVAPIFLGILTNTLVGQGVEVVPVILPDGEAYKTWETLNHIFDALLAHGCERKTTIIALGGGVVGDMAGFAAAVYQRGVPFIQVPTTLLAQVDSAVGGKTAINHPQGKNMIGAFYQPAVVIADTDTLNTLPQRELAAGLAEVIKYGVIRDPGFFVWLEANMDRLTGRNAEALAYAIEHSCRNKAEIVSLDERESGVRALLNFGHTFGHAIEAGLGYGQWLHGEAVAAGMVLAARLSARMNLIEVEDVKRISRLIERAGLPVAAPELGRARYMELMSHDKKKDGGYVQFVLLKGIGQAVISAAPPEPLYEILDAPAQHV